MRHPWRRPIRSRWRAQLTHHGEKIYLGLFDTAEEAAAVEALDIIPDGIRAARAAAHRFSTEQLALIVLTGTSSPSRAWATGSRPEFVPIHAAAC